MGITNIQCALLVVLSVHLSMVAGRQVIMPGGEFRHICPRYTTAQQDTDRYIFQVFTDKTLVKMFNSKTTSSTLYILANNTNIDENITNRTNRFSIEVDAFGIHSLLIKNLTDSDSAWYGCRVYDSQEDRIVVHQESRELFVPGPLRGLFWSGNYSKLDLETARAHEIQDGATVETNNKWYGPNVVCVVLVSNVEPEVNITIGPYGEGGSTDITDQFETRESSVTTLFEGGTHYRSTVFFVKKSQFLHSLQNVSCRASSYGTTFVKTVNILAPERPQHRQCNPEMFETTVGSKNVELSCRILGHPKPQIEWTLPFNRLKVSESSNISGYTVMNEDIFGGVKTTLIIAEVKEEDISWASYKIDATNADGTGTSYIKLERVLGPIGAAGDNKPCISISICAFILLLLLHLC